MPLDGGFVESTLTTNPWQRLAETLTSYNFHFTIWMVFMQRCHSRKFGCDFGNE